MPQFVRWFFPHTIWRIKSDEPTIYITFDDGPEPEITPKVLDILAKYDVKASFFCVGENVARHPQLFDAIKRRGHVVGNHTYNHLRGTKVSTERYVDNVQKAHLLIQSPLMRPPYGRITPAQRRVLSRQYKIIMWDYITYDFDMKMDAAKIIQGIKKNTRNGSIVVFHDSIKAAPNMLAALPLAIEYWQNKGYKLEAIRL